MVSIFHFGYILFPMHMRLFHFAGLKLILFLLCSRERSETLNALAQDHRNDVFSNSIALICGIFGKTEAFFLFSHDSFIVYIRLFGTKKSGAFSCILGISRLNWCYLYFNIYLDHLDSSSQS